MAKKAKLEEWRCVKCEINVITHSNHCRACCNCNFDLLFVKEPESEPEPEPLTKGFDPMAGLLCKECGNITDRTGTCHTCPVCGWNAGCG
jgi:hypothetical protein